MSNIHEEFSKRGARLVRRITGNDILAARAKFLDYRTAAVIRDHDRVILDILRFNENPSVAEIKMFRDQEGQLRSRANKEFSKPYWELMKKRKQRDLD